MRFQEAALVRPTAQGLMPDLTRRVPGNLSSVCSAAGAACHPPPETQDAVERCSGSSVSSPCVRLAIDRFDGTTSSIAESDRPTGRFPAKVPFARNLSRRSPKPGEQGKLIGFVPWGSNRDQCSQHRGNSSTEMASDSNGRRCGSCIAACDEVVPLMVVLT